MALVARRAAAAAHAVGLGVGYWCRLLVSVQVRRRLVAPNVAQYLLRGIVILVSVTGVGAGSGVGCWCRLLVSVRVRHGCADVVFRCRYWLGVFCQKFLTFVFFAR